MFKLKSGRHHHDVGRTGHGEGRSVRSIILYINVCQAGELITVGGTQRVVVHVHIRNRIVTGGDGRIQHGTEILHIGFVTSLDRNLCLLPLKSVVIGRFILITVKGRLSDAVPAVPVISPE